MNTPHLIHYKIYGFYSIYITYYPQVDQIIIHEAFDEILYDTHHRLLSAGLFEVFYQNLVFFHSSDVFMQANRRR